MSALLSAISSRIGQTVRALPSAVWSRVTSLGNNTTVTPLCSTWNSGQSGYLQRRLQHSKDFTQWNNLPPVPRLACKGDPFSTSVHRKRSIQDPNLPNFVHIEKLKWATWRMLRDIRRRHMFTRYYFNRQIYYNGRKCRMLPTTVREAFYETERALPRDSMIQMMHQRCAISGRSRGILKKYRLSRLVWRDLADNNKLSGVMKARW